jgi:flagellar FliJ protein
MRKFRFRLESVLFERKRIEDLRLRELTFAQQIMLQLRRELGELEDRLHTAFEEYTALVAQTDVSLGAVSALDSFITGLKQRIEWKKRDIERGAKLTERKRLEYVAARQRREALEKLKERQLSEFRAAARKHELKELDDLYVMTGAANRRRELEDNDGETEGVVA